MNLHERERSMRDEELSKQEAPAPEMKAREQEARHIDTNRAEPLSTRDLATGAATKQARAEEKNQQPAKETTQGGETTPLFNQGETEDFRSRWLAIQTQFVDDPKNSVAQADQLVASAIKRLAEVFATERENLEGNWDRGDDVSTEDLRIALQRYRSFFDRLLSV